MNVLWLFLAVPLFGFHYVLVVFPDHTHLLIDIINVLKKVIIWKQRLHRRTETRVYKFSGVNPGHLGLISDPLIISKFPNKTHDP